MNSKIYIKPSTKKILLEDMEKETRNKWLSTYSNAELIKTINKLCDCVNTLNNQNDQYLQKLVYALTPTNHELDSKNNDMFKKIIKDNIDLETCKIRRKLKEYWEDKVKQGNRF